MANSLFYRMHDRFFGRAAWYYQRLIHRVEIRPLFEEIQADTVILEIGGGYNPRFKKVEYPNVFHLDHSNTDDLRVKYADDPAVRHLIGNIQPIDFVTNGGPIERVIPTDLKFDLVFSSHVIEHQLDLISHLQSVENVLRSDGRAMFFIPDHRCCFDALRFPTVVGEVIQVHLAGAKVHQGKQILDHFSRTINVNPGRRVRRHDIRRSGFNHSIRQGFEHLQNSYSAGQAYVDAHAWVFSPLSFRLLLTELNLLGYTCLRPASISRSHGNQFCVVLRPDERFHGDIPDGLVDEFEAERLRLTKMLHG